MSLLGDQLRAMSEPPVEVLPVECTPEELTMLIGICESAAKLAAACGNTATAILLDQIKRPRRKDAFPNRPIDGLQNYLTSQGIYVVFHGELSCPFCKFKRCDKHYGYSLNWSKATMDQKCAAAYDHEKRGMQ